MGTTEIKSEDRTQELERIQQVIRAFDRALRSRRLYSGNNPVLAQHQNELISQFERHFTDHDELKLNVEPFELKVDGYAVYRNSNQQESLAFRLFNDGVRSLTFRVGLTDDEIKDFLDCIIKGISDTKPDTDAVTAFWEKEFEHIAYGVADSIIDEPTIDDKSTDEKIEEVLDPNMTMYEGAKYEGEEQGGADQAKGDEEIYQEFKITLNPTSVGQMFQDRCVLSTEELDEIQRDLAESERPERLVLDFTDMVLAVMQEEKDRETFEKATDSLGKILDQNLLHGDLNIARMVMEQVHKFPARPIELAKEDAQILSHTLKLLWPKSRIDLLIQCLNQEPKGTTEDIETLLQLLDPSILPYLLSRLTDIVDANRRKLVCAGVARLHRGDLGMFVPMISSKEPEQIRTGLYILGEMKNEKVVDLLPPLIQHNNLGIRKEAIAVLRNFRSAKSFKMLLNLMNDTTEEVRILSLRILAGSGDQEVARQLTAVLNREDFAEKSMSERKSYFHAVAKIAGDNFVPSLETMLATRSLFRKQGLEEVYQCATYALGVVATPRAREALEKAGQSRNKSVRRLSQTALRILDGSAKRGPS